MVRLSRLLPIVLLVASLQSLTAVAAAQENKAMAETLFQAGKALMKDGEYAQACAKFKASMGLDPSGGTANNLGACYEAAGKLASAWAAYNEAAVLARKERQEERLQYAQARIRELEPRLSRVRFGFSEGVPKGVSVELDGVPLDPAVLDLETPQDAGRHTVRARAEGYEVWETTFDVGGERQKVTVMIRPLKPLSGQAAVVPPDSAVEEQQPPPEPDKADSSAESKSTLGAGFWVSGAATLALGTGAIITGIVYQDQKSSYEAGNVPGCTTCNQEKASVETMGIVNISLLAGTAVAAGFTTYFLVTDLGRKGTADSGTAMLSPWVSTTGGGFVLRGRL